MSTSEKALSNGASLLEITRAQTRTIETQARSIESQARTIESLVKKHIETSSARESDLLLKNRELRNKLRELRELRELRGEEAHGTTSSREPPIPAHDSSSAAPCSHTGTSCGGSHGLEAPTREDAAKKRKLATNESREDAPSAGSAQHGACSSSAPDIACPPVRRLGPLTPTSSQSTSRSEKMRQALDVFDTSRAQSPVTPELPRQQSALQPIRAASPVSEDSGDSELRIPTTKELRSPPPTRAASPVRAASLNSEDESEPELVVPRARPPYY
ncbi:hypothetical protein FA09DRAFT_362972 [Tilletiopsis washingtonensis]|uniref:Uncharacterized protein n=1 Tax=Tilletiopsis washingtonensis TaxID=58919 RepID=A0A316Z597_9BASI|nr:hypothetical protein FA09DRAFT_362972 [Tilletiopsis washingtonensis]PWN95333.1 hypothetical protein FA09DRAFT_362972 [Tilletiopsis washingtonensis]